MHTKDQAGIPGAEGTGSPARLGGGRLFGLSVAGAAIRVESEVPGLDVWAARLLSPTFAVTPDPDPDLFTVRVVAAAPDALPTADPRAPRLQLDETQVSVLEHGAERVTVVQDDGLHPPMLISAVPGDAAVELAVCCDDADSLRPAVRFLKFVLAAGVRAGGAVFLHGAAVSRADRALLFLAPSGGGKSSLSFLAGSRAEWDVVSDDLLLLAGAPQRPALPVRVHGWPHRLGVSTAALIGHPARARFEQASLRRHGTPTGSFEGAQSLPWGRATRKRVYLDLDEFQQLTGARMVGQAVPAAVVLPQPEQERRGWTIERVLDRPAGWSRQFLADAGELKFMTDFLGLIDRSRFPAPVQGGGPALCRELEGLPAVRVRYGRDVNDRMPQFLAEVCDALGLAEVAR
ncbi:hypothetical protein [Kitasatospora sp. NPDC056181]|uniref:hypothetical protein n=1 Tax=Kitasatospora sp. NPDC056181 TaxID=3345737 RepID=UPI0035E38DE1